jgi:DNA repair protein RecN (Recombination protein N)
MLRRLCIENLAVVERAELEFRPGLNVITGSTGAGKSLIVGAVNLLLGERGSADLIRAGAGEAVVTATFAVPAPVPAALADRVDAGGEVQASRRVTRAGRSSATLGGRPATLRELRAACELLIEPHGQNEQYRLRDPESHVEYIDAYARAGEARARFEAALSSWRRAASELARFDAETARVRAQSELLAHRMEEIDRLAPRAGEKAELESSARLMAHAEKLFAALDEACGVLYDSDDAAVSRLAHARKRLSALLPLDARLAAMGEKLEQAESLTADVAQEARALRGALDFEPADVERVQARLDALARTERRYQSTIEQILAQRATWARELESLADAGANRVARAQELEACALRVAAAGSELSALRRRKAKEFDREVNAGLAEVMLRGASFRTEVTHAADETSGVRVDGRGVTVFEHGLDVVRLRVRTNPGEAEGPLEAVASAGELSRIALVLKPLAGGAGGTLIFDEIDAGVGADMGEALGEKLLALAAVHQIVCITHLPQIAARGNHHLVVLKEAVKDRTRVCVRAAAGEERTREIARMLGGSDGSAQRTALARELLSATTRPRGTRVRP